MYTLYKQQPWREPEQVCATVDFMKKESLIILLSF